jgi:ubiquinone/menaquinone biosynthesis C-methylase UbiE
MGIVSGESAERVTDQEPKEAPTMTTVMSDSIADPEGTPATAPPTHGRLQNAWGRCFAAIYEPLMQATENGGNAERRAAVLAHARGTVVEIGAGTGLNLPHYPTDVELVLTEPEPPMAVRLLDRLEQSGRQARVLQAPADRIPLPDDCADTVVCTLVLCTVHDLYATLSEIRRLLRPDGQLLFIEHVAAEPGTRLRRWQDRLERPWRRLAHGCHTNRDIEQAMREAGFAFAELEHGQMEAELLLRPLTWGTAMVYAG